MSSKQKRGLGSNNLDALLSGVTMGNAATDELMADKDKLRKLPIDKIQRGHYQPRRVFEEAALTELADSIKVQGVIQPIVVRLISDNSYEIIAGERRWRAAQMAGFDEIPAIVRKVDDKATIAMSLIENIQREDLNPIEEAFALQRLSDEFSLTHQEVADAVGKSRTTITNLLRLLSLSDDVKDMMAEGKLEAGHGKVLLALDGSTQSQVARLASLKGLTVRETDGLVKRTLAPHKKPAATKEIDPNIKNLQTALSEKLGAKVEFQHKPNGKGKLLVHYNSLEELEGILAHWR